MRVAALQLGGCVDDLAVNLVRARVAIAAAAEAGAKLAVLPELATVPFFCASPGGRYQRWSTMLDGPLVEVIVQDCAAHGIGVILPIYEQADNGACYNSAVAIGPRGVRLAGEGLRGEVAVARKLHLLSGPGGDEAAHFRPGDDVAVFEFGQLRVGCLICYDRRFPECWRAMRNLGADMVAAPIAGPSGEDGAFVLGELRTHARENGLAVVCAAKTGRERVDGADVTHPGGSCVIGADGAVLAALAEEPGQALADVTRASVMTARAALPLYEQCRRDLLSLGDASRCAC